MKQNVSTQNPKTHFRDVSFHPTVKRGGDLWDFTYDAAYYFAVLPLVFCFSFKRCICGTYSLSCPMCAFWMEDSKILNVVWMGPPNRAGCIYLVSSICFLHMFSSILTMHLICQWRKGNMTALFAQAHPGPFHPALQDMNAMSPQVIQMGDLIQFVSENENSLIKQIKCSYIKTCSLSTCCKLVGLYSLLRYKLFRIKVGKN